MKYEELEKINSRLKTTDIKGKDYVEVNQRILAFRELFELGAIETEILEMKDGAVTIKATIKDNGTIIATGLAQEKDGSTFINKTSYVENCETSAVGRALGMLGIGATTSIASYEEVQNAIVQQTEMTQKEKDMQIAPTNADALYNTLISAGFTDESIEETLLAKYNIKKTSELKGSQYAEIIQGLKKKGVIR